VHQVGKQDYVWLETEWQLNPSLDVEGKRAHLVGIPKQSGVF